MISGVRTPLIIAHRGFHAQLPENTIPAFAMAAELGFDGIETDVRLDRNGTPILFHNHILPDGRPVEAAAQGEISDIMGYEIPSLAQALQDIENMVWDIEIKTMAAVAPAIKILAGFVRIRDIFVSSFIHAAVRQIVAALHIRGALLVSHCPDGSLFAPNPAPGIDTIVWDCNTVDHAALQWAMRSGLRSMVYGYRPEPAHAAFLTADLDAIITDYSQPILNR